MALVVAMLAAPSVLRRWRAPQGSLLPPPRSHFQHMPVSSGQGRRGHPVAPTLPCRLARPAGKPPACLSAGVAHRTYSFRRNRTHALWPALLSIPSNLSRAAPAAPTASRCSTSCAPPLAAPPTPPPSPPFSASWMPASSSRRQGAAGGGRGVRMQRQVSTSKQCHRSASSFGLLL